MPTPKRPQPEFPQTGFLGQLPDLGGGAATEWSITIPHPLLPGFWTNVPSLVPGQQATNTLPGAAMTQEQFQRARDFATFLAKSGYQLPAFKTAGEAAFQAAHRHKAMEGGSVSLDQIRQLMGGGPLSDETLRGGGQ